jgi:hypothetical protein
VPGVGPEGRGQQYSESGKLKYDGEWQNGYHHGQGKSYNAAGELEHEGLHSKHGRYVGDWVPGIGPHGSGKLYTRLCVSQLCHDQWCIPIYLYFLSYDGDWKHGYREGLGREYENYLQYSCEGAATTTSNMVYEGLWKRDRPDGQGKRYFTTYDYDHRGIGTKVHYVIYDGEWQDGRRCGHGIEYETAGMVAYEGEWKDDERNGYGKEYSYHTLKYEGCWVDGFPNGYGIQYTKSGVKYGSYHKGERLRVY